jgi:hypothetical protein
MVKFSIKRLLGTPFAESIAKCVGVPEYEDMLRCRTAKGDEEAVPPDPVLIYLILEELMGIVLVTEYAVE